MPPQTQCRARVHSQGKVRGYGRVICRRSPRIEITRAGVGRAAQQPSSGSMPCGGVVYPRSNLAIEDVERHGPFLEQGVVELSDVEPRPEPLLRPGAQLADFQLAHLVSKCLPGPHDV